MVAAIAQVDSTCLEEVDIEVATVAGAVVVEMDTEYLVVVAVAKADHSVVAA